jgi:hypothetical protein
MKLTVLKVAIAATFFGLATTGSASAQTLPGSNDLDLRSQAIDYCVSQLGVLIEMSEMPACIQKEYNELWWAKYGPNNGPGGPQGPTGDPAIRCTGRLSCTSL